MVCLLPLLNMGTVAFLSGTIVGAATATTVAILEDELPPNAGFVLGGMMGMAMGGITAGGIWQDQEDQISDFHSQ